jgi:hypothetical protein
MLRSITLAAAGVLAASSALALDLPTRKPGLWELKMTMDGGGIPPMVSHHCTDAATDKAMHQMAGGMGREMCSKQEVRQVGNTLVMDSICSVGGMTMTTQGMITGDFNSAYTMKMTSKRTGGPAVPGMPDTTTMTIEAKWTGACKAGQRPGDIIMAGGMKMNIRDMGKMGMPTR